MRASSYTYAEATTDERLASWIGANVRAFDFFKARLSSSSRTTLRLALRKPVAMIRISTPHIRRWRCIYGVGVGSGATVLAGQGQGRIGVLLAERWIVAALRHRMFSSIWELNQAIRELRDRINQRPFRKREG